MLIIKGVNVYPSAIKEAVDHFRPKTTGVMKIILERPGPLVKPPLRVQVEYADNTSTDDIAIVRDELQGYMKENLRINPDIEM